MCGSRLCSASYRSRLGVRSVALNDQREDHEMRSIIRVTASVICFVLLLAFSGDLRAQDCGVVCTQNVDPDPGGDDGGSCPSATNYQTCMSRCDCRYSHNLARCGANAVCVDMALSARNDCYEYCGRTYSDPD